MRRVLSMFCRLRRDDALGVKKTDYEESFGLEFFQTHPDHMDMSSDGWGACDTDFAVPVFRSSSTSGSSPSNSVSSSEPTGDDCELGVVACSKRKLYALRERDGTVPQLKQLEHRSVRGTCSRVDKDRRQGFIWSRSVLLIQVSRAVYRVFVLQDPTLRYVTSDAAFSCRTSGSFDSPFLGSVTYRREKSSSHRRCAIFR